MLPVHCRACDLSKYPVDKGRTVSTAESLRQLYCLIDGNSVRYFLVPLHLINRKSQDCKIYLVHTSCLPSGRMLIDHCIDFINLLYNFLRFFTDILHIFFCGAFDLFKIQFCLCSLFCFFVKISTKYQL